MIRNPDGSSNPGDTAGDIALIGGEFYGTGSPNLLMQKTFNGS